MGKGEMWYPLILVAFLLVIIIAALLLFVTAIGLAASVWGGPECFNDYSMPSGYEGGCYGGMIRYRGAAAFPLLVGLPAFFLLSHILPPPKFRDWYMASRFRRRRLFLWLEVNHG